MKTETIDNIIEDLFHVLRLIHKKFARIDLKGANQGISRHDFAIMATLDEFGKLPVSEIGERLLIPRPQMTHLVNKLISLGIVERLPDARDRRITRISLTQRGKTVLEESWKVTRDSVRKNLGSLEDEELEELSVLLRKLRDIGSRLELRKTA